MAITIETMFEEAKRRLPRLERKQAFSYVNNLDLLPWWSLVLGVPLAVAVFAGIWSIFPFAVFIVLGFWGILGLGGLVGALEEKDQNLAFYALILPVVFAAAAIMYTKCFLLPPRGLIAAVDKYPNHGLNFKRKDFEYLKSNYPNELASAMMLSHENAERQLFLAKYANDKDMQVALTALQEEKADIQRHLETYLSRRDEEILAQENVVKKQKNTQEEIEFQKAQDLAAEIIARKNTREILEGDLKQQP